ncbi:MAG: hybrid sensor histidine kinase/response regulator [Bacteroidetes bacterium]|nr:hybrid sensor histidine kinase/response regulator [Bacteroidota bacterium]
MKKASILIVEDEYIVARDIAARVERQGYRVAEIVASGEDAVTQAGVTRPDLVLMDIKLSGPMDGVEAAEKIRASHDIPVVYLTAFADERTLERAKVTDAFGYLLKPFEERELHITIEMALYKHDVERRMRDNERWLATTLKSIGDGVMSTDAEGRITFMNPVAETLTGWPADVAVGLTVDTVLRRSPGGDSIVHRDGHLCPIEETAAPLRDERGNVVGSVIVFRDITERNRLEEQLRQSQKLESIGTLASGIAHDFNNILNGVLGFTGQLRKYAADPEKVARYTQTIEQSANRGAELCSRILSFARKSSREQVPTDIGSVVSEVVNVCRETFPRSIALSSFAEEGLAPVLGDRGELYQVLLNLCVNARDAVATRHPDGGGNVRVEARSAVAAPDLPPGSRLRAGDKCVELRVSDNGSGMSSEVRDKIFDPFFTTKSRGQGTGLGLSMVYSIVQNHGGVLSFESEEGVGTTFRIVFPPCDRAVEVTRQGPATEPKPPQAVGTNDELVLVVDDEPTMLDLAKELLQEQGYSVITAANGRDGIEALRRRSAEVRLVLLDLMMPEMDGIAALREMRKIRGDIKALFCTGYMPEDVRHRLPEEEHLNILQKPFDPARLFSMVRSRLDAGGGVAGFALSADRVAGRA